MKEITRVGIDLGKHVYQVCAMDAAGAVVFQRQVKAPRLMELMARIEPCRVGMEASGGAHRWVEKLIELGHDVRMMSPQFVRPYVKSNKSDYHDAEAICEAVSRPTMRFVPYKTKERRALQQVHRSRELALRPLHKRADHTCADLLVRCRRRRPEIRGRRAATAALHGTIVPCATAQPDGCERS